MRRVYQFGLRPPTENASRVRDQLRHAHAYRNDLVAIERGRRDALRRVDDTFGVQAALSILASADPTEKKRAIADLRQARLEARRGAEVDLALIAFRESEALRDARSLTPTYWGTYLGIEAAHQQSRAMPLYGDDAVTPNDPRFVRWQGEGQLGVQLQKGLSTADALAAKDSRVRLRLHDAPYGHLDVRIGSHGRDPVWATFPIKMHRVVPDAALWKWVRVSLRKEGTREIWTTEITVDDPAPHPHARDASLTGAVAFAWDWSERPSGDLRVATWSDSRGASGEVLLPARVVLGIQKPDGIRSVRDKLRNGDAKTGIMGVRDRVAHLLRTSTEARPPWLDDAANAMPTWNSHDRFYDLVQRWRREKVDACREAYDALQAWELRDAHLYDYEAGARREAHRERREIYRVLAARMSRSYAHVLLSDQDLSREARFGDASERRFLAGPYELRGSLRNAFGPDHTLEAPWKKGDEGPVWCSRTVEAWARGEGSFTGPKVATGNAWAARKAKAKEKREGRVTP